MWTATIYITKTCTISQRPAARDIFTKEHHQYWRRCTYFTYQMVDVLMTMNLFNHNRISKYYKKNIFQEGAEIRK